MTDTKQLSDEEVIARFMEPKPAATITHGQHVWSCGEWWEHTPNARDWEPHSVHINSLDCLWLVEERLSDQQWDHYEAILGMGRAPWPHLRRLIHATAADKIKALATVLRGAY